MSKSSVRRLSKVEHKKRQRMPVTYGIVYMGDENAKEKEEKIKRDYLEKHGTSDGLVIVRSMIPDPLPPVSEEVLNKLWSKKNV